MSTTPLRDDTDVPLPEWTLGWRLRRSLEHAGLTAQEMADTLSVTPSTISRWTRDEVIPRRLFLERWAEECRLPLSWLVDEAPPKAKPAGRRTVTDNKSFTDSRRTRRKTTRDNHSYRYCRKVNNAYGLDSLAVKMLNLPAWRDHPSQRS